MKIYHLSNELCGPDGRVRVAFTIEAANPNLIANLVGFICVATAIQYGDLPPKLARDRFFHMVAEIAKKTEAGMASGTAPEGN